MHQPASQPTNPTHPFVQEPHRDDGVGVDAWRQSDGKQAAHHGVPSQCYPHSPSAIDTSPKPSPSKITFLRWCTAA